MITFWIGRISWRFSTLTIIMIMMTMLIIIIIIIITKVLRTYEGQLLVEEALEHEDMVVVVIIITYSQ